MGPAAAHPSDHVLDLYLLGRLTPEEDATVTTHVEACEECQEHIAETIKLIQELRLAFGHGSSVTEAVAQRSPLCDIPGR
jgi:anti-sigma factor RsiW